MLCNRMYLFLEDLLESGLRCHVSVEALLSIYKGSQEKEKIRLILCAQLEKVFKWSIF